MRVKKWIMKQQWRIVQIRGIWGLFYGILLLAYAYYEYVPFFSEMGTLGPFAFSAAVFLGFIILGYIYDRVLILWAPSQEVSTERNPYQFVPSPQDRIFWFPLFSSLLDISEQMAEHFDVETEQIDETREYYHKLNQLKAIRKEDIATAEKLRDEFMSRHHLSDIIEWKGKK